MRRGFVNECWGWKVFESFKLATTCRTFMESDKLSDSTEGRRELYLKQNADSDNLSLLKEGREEDTIYNFPTSCRKVNLNTLLFCWLRERGIYTHKKNKKKQT